MYLVKTRNWYGTDYIYTLLNWTKKFGVIEYSSIYWLHTKNPLKAWLFWLYFMILKKWSGGWTYIVRPKTQNPKYNEYRCIY
uniref:Uncharacterized protein n=1 Tax=viral metagenome TaxID=1070528 RepID=A0A6H1ZCA2_9ZZZZ